MTITKEVRPIISKNRNRVNRLSDRNTPMVAPQVNREKKQYLPRLPRRAKYSMENRVVIIHIKAAMVL